MIASQLAATPASSTTRRSRPASARASRQGSRQRLRGGHPHAARMRCTHPPGGARYLLIDALDEALAIREGLNDRRRAGLAARPAARLAAGGGHDAEGDRRSSAGRAQRPAGRGDRRPRPPQPRRHRAVPRPPPGPAATLCASTARPAARRLDARDRRRSDHESARRRARATSSGPSRRCWASSATSTRFDRLDALPPA